MNKIRELRRARGWTAEELASRVGTTQATITRLESGQRRLNVDWINLIAAAFGVTPAEIMGAPRAFNLTDDIGPAAPSYATVANALRSRGFKLYEVRSNALADQGLNVGDTITVDETPDGIKLAGHGDCLVVDVSVEGATVRLLRQFLAPRTLLTNRPGLPSVLTLDDPALNARITGLVIRD